MQVNSLKFRLVVSAILTVVLLLPLIGLIINNAFVQHLTLATEKQLTAHSYAILADIELINGELFLPNNMQESRFNVIDSGLYALVTGVQNSNKLTRSKQVSNIRPLWRSGSALNWPTDSPLQVPVQGEQLVYQFKQNQRTFLALSYQVVLSELDNELPVVLHILLDQRGFEQSVTEFKKQLSLGLFLLFIVILVLQVFWLRWVLTPMKSLKAELAQIEKGELEQTTKTYPAELQLVTGQLNHLLKNEQSQRKKYRNALSDLAHSLKTPLAVLHSSQDISNSGREELDTINQIIEHQLKKAQSAGQSIWRLSFLVNPCIEKLLSALTKIYHDKGANLVAEVPENANFKGDEGDFMEIAGNLLDNAYKACKKSVKLTISYQESDFILTVEDDGIGIDDAYKTDILTRGTRADTYEKGHGIGLAIVRDLVESYQGQLDIGTSNNLGGAKFTITIPQHF